MGRGSKKKITEDEADERITRMLAESGERDRFRQRLYANLEKSGWREEVKLLIKDSIRDDTTVEDLIQKVAPKATDLVPDKQRKELAHDVQKVLERAASD